MGENSWSREELENAYQNWHATVNRAGSGEGSWRDFLELFTEDVVYHEQMAGVLEGRDGIWKWAEPSLAQFPGSHTVSFPEYFHVIDETNGTIVAKLDNVMSDPGDGSVWGAPHVSILTYAGNGRFSRQEDIYDVTSFLDLIKAWGRRAMELGTFDATQRAWFAQVYPETVPSSAADR
ncbi:nuclear transport factor 2 family protein [Rhodococcus rhodochrous]|uniref:Nuclear transport factor 2 family protein n=1 Tax=Rhodococcus rhodochrous TaxID=1829 RepID=A0AAW4XIY6_RHORH|nr:nuclear transport factor 2 family protein [Rhodococcus rhodochrous]MCD2112887.1 nuclear transport factor 2 family protein [Rhodococcus rhodochrous]